MTNPKARTPPPPRKPAKNHPWKVQGGPKPDSQLHVAYRDRMGIRG